MSISRFRLSLCELYHPATHGLLEGHFRLEYIYGSYLCTYLINAAGYFSKNFGRNLLALQRSWDDRDITFPVTHPYVRQYSVMNCGPQVEIIQPVVLPSGHYLAIIKTSWLKIFQRKWKNYYRRMIAKRSNPSALLRRRIYGKWKFA